MANVDAAFGLHLHEDTSKTPLELCFIPASDATAVFVGDAVKTGGSAGNTVGNPKKRTVTQAAAGDPIYGVVQGFLQHWNTDSMDLSKRFRAASTDLYVLIKPANNQDIYRIQADDDSVVIGDADIGLNANLVVNAGSTITGISGMELDSDTKATTATLQLKIIGYDDRPSNEQGSANQDLLVRLNNVELSGGTGTLGV